MFLGGKLAEADMEIFKQFFGVFGITVLFVRTATTGDVTSVEPSQPPFGGCEEGSIGVILLITKVRILLRSHLADTRVPFDLTVSGLSYGWS